MSARLIICELDARWNGFDPNDKVTSLRKIFYKFRCADGEPFTYNDAEALARMVRGEVKNTVVNEETVHIVHIPVEGVLPALRSFEHSTKFRILEFPPVSVMRHVHNFMQKKVADEETIKARLGPLYDRLRVFQMTSVRLASKLDAVYIGDDMGTGKTLQAIAISVYHREHWPILVICPPILRYGWKAEFLKWAPEWVEESDIRIIKNSEEVVDDKRWTKEWKRGKWVDRPAHEILIISYSLLTNVKVRERLYGRYKIVIVDESHFIKSRDAQRTLAVQEMIRPARIRLLMSGTPSYFPAEAWSQVSALYPEIYPNFYDEQGLDPNEVYFAQRYCEPKRIKFGATWQWEFRGYKRLRELHAVLCTMMIRRNKKEVLPYLPPKNRFTLPLPPLPENQQEEIKELLKKEEGEEASMKGRRNFMESFRLTCTYKIPNVIKFVKSELVENVLANAPDTKFILFFHHSEMRLTLEEFVKSNGYSYKVIYGCTPDSERATFQDEFQAGKYTFAILSITACAAGLTLTRSNMVVFTEILFGADLHTQAEDRAARMGQTHDSVNIIYLLQSGAGTDEINIQVIKNKQRKSSEYLDGRQSHLLTTRINPTEDEDLHSIIVGRSNKRPACDSKSKNKKKVTKKYELDF